MSTAQLLQGGTMCCCQGPALMTPRAFWQCRSSQGGLPAAQLQVGVLAASCCFYAAAVMLDTIVDVYKAEGRHHDEVGLRSAQLT